MAGIVVSRMLGFAAKNVKTGVFYTQGVFVVIYLHVTVDALACDTYPDCCIDVNFRHLERIAVVGEIKVLYHAQVNLEQNFQFFIPSPKRDAPVGI